MRRHPLRHRPRHLPGGAGEPPGARARRGPPLTGDLPGPNCRSAHRVDLLVTSARPCLGERAQLPCRASLGGSSSCGTSWSDRSAQVLALAYGHALLVVVAVVVASVHRRRSSRSASPGRRSSSRSPTRSARSGSPSLRSRWSACCCRCSASASGPRWCASASTRSSRCCATRSSGCRGSTPTCSSRPRGMGMSEAKVADAGAPPAGVAGDPRRRPGLDPDVDGCRRHRGVRPRPRVRQPGSSPASRRPAARTASTTR